MTRRRADTAERWSRLLQIAVLATVVLYFGRPVLLPVMLAVLLTFLLRPIVLWLERRRVPRAAAVILTLSAILLGLVFAGGIITGQMYELASHLDEYQGHLHAKITVLRDVRTGAVDNIRGIVHEVRDAFNGKPEPSDAATPSELPATGEQVESVTSPVAQTGIPESEPASDARPNVSVVPAPSAVTTPADALRVIWDAFSTPVAMLTVSLVLVVFSLLGFEELRNRMYRLAGETRLTLTTKALDDISRRISRYLLMNAMVNGGFGLAMYLGLTLIGVEYAAVWGLLAAILRFMPYVGPVTAMLLPLVMATIQFPDWTHPALVAGLFLVIELLTNNFVEPLAYGKGAGVSTVALLVAAAFWAWLWGPLGLVLSVPLTVVLAVMGKHIPQFEPLAILLGDEPALDPSAVFYQRLLAGDVDEAADLLEGQLRQDRPTAYDRLVMPALALAERDRYRGDLEEADKFFVWNTAQSLVDENGPADSTSAEVDESPGRHISIMGCPAQDLADALALTMLRQMTPAGCRLINLSPALMASEKFAKIADQKPDGVLISALGPGGASSVRYLCKRIRQEFPRLPILVGRWEYHGDVVRLTASLKARGADHVVTTLAAALDQIKRIQPLPK